MQKLMLISNFKLKFEKNRVLVEKNSIYCRILGVLFSVIVFKLPRNAIGKSEIHLVMGEIAFLIRNI
jgi:hypothetical protein